jgi:hypothetical protein
VGLIVVVAVAVLAATALRSTALDPQAVDRNVAAQFEQQQGMGLDLRCPDGMTVTPGNTYRCSGTTADGTALTIRITITDKDANYTWSAG